jgi:hypothetical protein
MQHELHPRPGLFQVPEQVPGLLDDPGLTEVLGGSEDPDAAGAVLDDGQDVTVVPLSRSAVKKSSARIPRAWHRGNSAQPGPSRRGAGLIPALLRIRQTVDGTTLTPSLGEVTRTWTTLIPEYERGERRRKNLRSWPSTCRPPSLR